MGKAYFTFKHQASSTDMFQVTDTTLRYFNSTGTAVFDVDVDDSELSIDGLLLRAGIGSTFTHATGGDDVGVEGDLEVLGSAALGELSADPTNLANRGIFYTKEVATVTEGFYVDSAGNVTQLTTGGASPFQNLWQTISSDSGSVAANTTTDTLTIAGGKGVDTSVSGDTLTAAIDLNELTTDTGIAAGDFIPFYDISPASNDKITFANFEGALNHDSLTGFVANEHIDHTAVTLTAGEGLTGGGDISANRSFAIDLNELTTDTVIAAGDFIPFYDISPASQDKITFANLEATIDHGSVAGLTDDDHTQYALVNGTRAFTGDQSMGSNKLTSVTDPTAAQDAATKNYVDATHTISVDVGRFTRDTSLATGTQAITGVGFQPVMVIFFAAQDLTSEASWGFDDGTTDQVLNDLHSFSADTYKSSDAGSINIVQSGTDSYVGNISSFDADGFTVSWTKNGTPTGTVGVDYLALR